jgi:hypothetical protein
VSKRFKKEGEGEDLEWLQEGNILYVKKEFVED